MIPYIALDQITLGPIKLYTWGIFVALGFSAGYLLLLYLAKQKNIAPEKIAGLALAIFFGGIIGAKALPVALLPSGFFNNLNLLLSQHSGAMFMGGLIGAIIFGWGYWKIADLIFSLPCEGEGEGGVNFWQVADLLVLPTALGIAIGRIGCILINDHQGVITALPWGLLWPDGIIRHPVGIYESLAGLALFIIFWWLQKNLFYSSSESCGAGRVEKLSCSSRLRPAAAGLRSNNKPGQLSLIFLASYSVIRFLLDFTRVSSGPLADPRWGMFSASQWAALLILTLSIFVLLLLNNKKRRN